MAWQKVKDAGAQVSLAVPIEMNMRHGYRRSSRWKTWGFSRP